MELVSYPVRYFQDEEGGWNAEFPGLGGGGCIMTCAESFAQVQIEAEECLTAYILSFGPEEALEEAREPEEGEDSVIPFLPVAIALTVRKMRKNAGMTQSQAARIMQVSQPTYARWEDPHKNHASLETLNRIAKTFGYRIKVSFSKAS